METHRTRADRGDCLKYDPRGVFETTAEAETSFGRDFSGIRSYTLPRATTRLLSVRRTTPTK